MSQNTETEDSHIDESVASPKVSLSHSGEENLSGSDLQVESSNLAQAGTDVAGLDSDQDTSCSSMSSPEEVDNVTQPRVSTVHIEEITDNASITERSHSFVTECGEDSIPSKLKEGLQISAKAQSLNDKLRVLRQEAESSRVRPMDEILQDKDVDIDEILIENTTIIDSTPSTSDERFSSVTDTMDTVTQTQFTSIEDTPSGSGYCVSEAESLSKNKEISLVTETQKCKYKVVQKKTVVSNGTSSSNSSCCDAIRRITTNFQKMKISDSPESVPASFNDNLDELSILKDENQSKENKSNNVPCEFSNLRDMCTETAHGVIQSEQQTEADLDKQDSISSIITSEAENLQSSSNLAEYCPSTELPSPCKFPDPPRIYIISPKLRQSQNMELSTSSTFENASENSAISKSGSPRRPTDLPMSPRQSFYTFWPANSSDILRQSHSLPGLDLRLNQDNRRWSTHFENCRPNTKPESLESSLSSNIRNVARDLFRIGPCHLPDISPSDLDISPSDESEYCFQKPDMKNPESSVSDILDLSNRTARKKVIFVSDGCENTNVTPTLQESSPSSMGVTSDVANLQIKDSTVPDSEFTKSVSPSKRKRSSPDLCVSECSSGIQKKVRSLSEAEKRESAEISESQKRVPGSQSDIPKKARPSLEAKAGTSKSDGITERHEEVKHSRTHLGLLQTDSRTTGSACSLDYESAAVGSESNIEEHASEIPVDENLGNEPKRKMKRSQRLSSDETEDTTETSSEVKKKKLTKK